MYTQTTHGIKVTVLPHYLNDQSEPDENQFIWAYTIQLENHGSRTVQLMSRHWRITDGLGRRQDVRGEGVVGEQPVIRPGEAFQYTSGVPLSTPSGIMAGAYKMQLEDGSTLQVEVPTFSLDSPFSLGRPN